MKNRKSIIFFLFWSLVFSAVLFILSFMGKHDVKTSGGSLSSLDVGKITRIDICRRVEANRDENLLMVRSSGKWLLESPVKAEADDESVRRMLETLVFAELGDSLSRSDMAALGRSLRDFGLASPGCTVMISAGDAKETFMIGRKTAPAFSSLDNKSRTLFIPDPVSAINTKKESRLYHSDPSIKVKTLRSQCIYCPEMNLLSGI